MKLYFNDKQIIECEEEDNPVQAYVRRAIKHLCHVELDFKDWMNPFSSSQSFSIMQLKKYAQKLNIEIKDNFSQQDFNHLHEIYEKNYDGRSIWLDFHDYIHVCQNPEENNYKILHIDWREKASPLYKKFNYEYMQYASPEIEKGDIYVWWSELGKTPYHYWENREPNNTQRLCELAKPWITLRPRLFVAFENFNFVRSKQVDAFETWWKKYHSVWCKHWNIPKWTLRDQFSVIKVGKVVNIIELQNILEQKIPLKKVVL